MKKIKIGQIILLLVLAVLAILSVLPILLVLIASFTSERSLAANGFSFLPEEWSMDGWVYVLGYGDQLLTSYGVTILITCVGTLTSLLIMSMMAYALARKSFVLRNFLSMMLLITMLFSGGQLSGYLVRTTMYHLKDTLIVLMLPAVSTMYVIIIRTYIQSNITDSLIESAKIDGAGEFKIYTRIVMPLLPPVLASVGFMLAIGYWNDWQTGYLYITSMTKTPLQLLLMRIEKQIELMNNPEVPVVAALAIADSLPEIGARMAMLFTVLGPIMIAYPFFQKYFVKGLTMGAVKG